MTWFTQHLIKKTMPLAASCVSGLIVGYGLASGVFNHDQHVRKEIATIELEIGQLERARELLDTIREETTRTIIYSPRELLEAVLSTHPSEDQLKLLAERFPIQFESLISENNAYQKALRDGEQERLKYSRLTSKWLAAGIVGHTAGLDFETNGAENFQVVTKKVLEPGRVEPRSSSNITPEEFSSLVEKWLKETSLPTDFDARISRSIRLKVEFPDKRLRMSEIEQKIQKNKKRIIELSGELTQKSPQR